MGEALFFVSCCSLGSMASYGRGETATGAYELCLKAASDVGEICGASREIL